MAKKKKRISKAAILREHPRFEVLGKRAAAYEAKLKTLRSIMGGFDAKKFTTLQQSKPKSAKARAARRAGMQKVSRAFERLRPFVHRSYKLVKPGKRAHFDSLRRYVGVTPFRKLRAIPFPTTAKKLSVRFDRQGRPLIREDGLGQKVFLFPHIPRSQLVKGLYGAGRFVDAEEDAIYMLKQMLPQMREGYYIFMSRHHFLIPFSASRDKLEEETRRFYGKYEGSPEFLATFFGFKFMTDSEERWFAMKDEMTSERKRRKGRRQRALAARALKEIIAMDKQLKAGIPLTRGQTTRRVKLRTMGEAAWQREKREAEERKLRNRKLSKRARATGRR